MALPIRLRLALVCGGLVALLVAGLGAFVALRLGADLRATVDAGLRSRTEVLLSSGDPVVIPEVGGLAEPEEAFVQILDGHGAALETSAGLPQEPLLAVGDLRDLPVGGRSFDRDVRIDEELVPARLFAVPMSDGRILVVGGSVEDQEEALARLRALLIVGGLAAAGLSMAVGWIVSGAALRPVERMRVEAEAVSASEPGRRLAPTGTRDELARLAESLNAMLARLEEAMERERRFVDDASHELRTPLANLRAELDLALRRSRTNQELVASLRSASDDAERLHRLADDLLVLARADDGRLRLHREDVDVAELVEQTVDGFSARAANNGITIRTSPDGVPPAARVDPVRLGQAVSNVVDNALRNTPPRGTVTVDLFHRDGVLVVEVADTGDGFPPRFLDEAFQPFRRAHAGRARTDGGAGLGLSIVRAVAEAHGGTVTAANRAEGGAVVTIRIPTERRSQASSGG